MAVKRKEKRAKGAGPELPAYPESAEWEIKIAFANMGEKRGFMADSQTMVETGDEGMLYPWMAEFIKRWPFELDPSDVDSYDKLTLDQFDEARDRMVQAMASFRGKAV
jgi:hypothetical protein